MNVTDIPTSAELIAHLRAGSHPDAWLRFAQRYRQPLLDFASARQYHTIDLECIVQETLRLVIAKLSTQDCQPENTRFRDWLLGHLNQRLQHALRSEHSRRHREIHYVQTQTPPNEPCSDAALWRRVCLRQAVRQLLNDPAIAGRTRAVFIEASLKGRPTEDVAKEFGLTPNAVYQIKFRCITRLREAMRAMR